MNKKRLWIIALVSLAITACFFVACRNNECNYEKVTVEATCTTDGYTAMVCKDCGKELKGSRVALPATGHNLVAVPGLKAMCTTDGYTEHKKCVTCGQTENYAIVKAAHEYEYFDAKEATCDTEGYTAYKKCVACGDMVGKTIISAAHKFVSFPEKAATCTTEGYTAYKKCSVCDLTEGKETIEPAHSFVYVPEKVATCTTEGYSAHRRCDVCGKTEGKMTIKSAHSFVKASGKAATCTADGYSDYEKCKLCGEERGKTILRARHTFVEVSGKQATCTENGYTDFQKCSGCGVEQNKNIIVASHSFIEIEEAAATCTEDGHSAYRRCEVCGKETGKIIYGAKHSFITMPAVAATCRQPGNSEYEKCSVCGEERNKRIYTAPHTYKQMPSKEAGCTEDGYSVYYKCTQCGEEIGKSIIAASHDIVSKPGKEATCTMDGYTEYKECRVCGMTEGGDVIKAAHKPVAMEGKAPTCTEDGYTAYEKCSVCGQITGKQTIAGGHVMVAVEAKEATCTSDGYTAHEKCVNCDLIVGKTVIKASHEYETVAAKKATCAQPGYSAHQRCINCGNIVGKTEIKVPHTFVTVVEKPATCTTDGYTAHVKCAECGTENGKETIIALGHSYGDFTTVSEATCTNNRVEKAVCARCSEEIQQEVEGSMLPHAYAKNASLDENGLKAYVCSECNSVDMRSPVKVAVLSGQSNAVGYSVSKYLKNSGSPVSAEKYEQYKNGYENVLIRYNNNDGASEEFKHTTSGNNFVTVKLGQGVGLQYPSSYPDGAFGAEVGIAERWNKTYPDETLYIIKYAYGGTTLYSDWRSPSSAAREGLSVGAQYDKMTAYVRSSIALMEQAGLAPEIQAFIWMQGESDAEYHYYTYYNRYDEFVCDVRGELSDYSVEKGLAFIDGGISAYWTNYQKINDIKREYSLGANKNYFIDTVAAGLTYDKDNGDYAHFDSVPMLKLGDMFGAALIESVEDQSAFARNLLVTDGVTASEAFTGNGTESDPYLLTSADDWLLLAAKIAGGVSFAGKYFKATENVYLTHPKFDPIGLGQFNYTAEGVLNNGAFYANGEEKLFDGTLDGNGKSVNIRFYRQERAVALFRGIAPGGTLKNLTVKGEVFVTDGQKWIAAGVAAYNGGTISGCNNYAKVNAFSRQAGIAARNVGAVINCNNYGDILCNSNDCRVGGIVGEATEGSVVSGCENFAKVTGKLYVGGVVGVSKYGKIIDCKNRATVTANRFGSGICAYMTANVVSGCDNYGDIVCSGALPTGNTDHQNIAGVCAYAEANSSITNCNNYGNVYGDKLLFIAGGVAAHVKATTVTGCNNYGNVTSADDSLANTMRGYIGGVVAWGESSSKVTECVNTGVITNVFFRSGGVIGYLNGSTCDKLTNGSASNPEAGKIIFSSVTANCCRNACVVGELNGSTLGSSVSTEITTINYGNMVNAHMWNGCVVGVADNSKVYAAENRGTYTYKNNTYDIGGIVGHVINKVVVANCVNRADMSGKYNVGGIVGGALATTEITNCKNYGAITSADAGKCGGISGSNLGVITNCSDIS